MSSRQPEHELSAAERAAILATFWGAPDDARFPPDIIAVVCDHPPSTLASMRSDGTGPEFWGGPRNVAYRKRDVVAWLDRVGVFASNAAEARQMRAELRAA